MFHVEVDSLVEQLRREDKMLPEQFVTYLRSNPNIWIKRALDSGKFFLDAQLEQHWPVEATVEPAEEYDKSRTTTTLMKTTQ